MIFDVGVRNFRILKDFENCENFQVDFMFCFGVVSVLF